MRFLFVLALLAGVMCDARAQRIASAPHPVLGAEWMLALRHDRAIYRDADRMYFVDGDRVQSRPIGGVLMRAKASGGHVGLLVKEGAALRIDQLDASGSLQRSVPVPHHSDDPVPQFAPGPDLVYALPALAEVCFPGRCIRLFKDAAYDIERNVFVDVSPDGRFVAVAGQRQAARPGLAGPNAFVFIFDREGSLIARHPLDQPSVRALAFSPASLIAVSTYDAHASPMAASRVLTLAGDVVGDAPYGADAFAFGAESVYLMASKQVAAVDLRDGSARVLYAGSIVDAAAEGDELVVLTGTSIYENGGFVYDGLRLVHVDAAGPRVIDVVEGRQRSPGVAFDDGIATLFLDSGIRTYR